MIGMLKHLEIKRADVCDSLWNPQKKHREWRGEGRWKERYVIKRAGPSVPCRSWVADVGACFKILHALPCV